MLLLCPLPLLEISSLGVGPRARTPHELLPSSFRDHTSEEQKLRARGPTFRDAAMHSVTDSFRDDRSERGDGDVRVGRGGKRMGRGSWIGWCILCMADVTRRLGKRDIDQSLGRDEKENTLVSRVSVPFFPHKGHFRFCFVIAQSRADTHVQISRIVRHTPGCRKPFWPRGTRQGAEEEEGAFRNWHWRAIVRPNTSPPEADHSRSKVNTSEVAVVLIRTVHLHPPPILHVWLAGAVADPPGHVRKIRDDERVSRVNDSISCSQSA